MLSTSLVLFLKSVKMLTVKMVSVFIIGFSSVLADTAGECDMAGFYLELGCTPVPNPDPTSKCPEAFSCPDLHPKADKCYYRGVPYSDGSMIPQGLINNPCSQACGCSISGAPEFNCASVDCVEFYNPDLRDCVNTYELDSCCSTGTVCGKDAIAALKTCEVDGQTYKEGQTFEPANTRKTCICTANWNGTYDDPSTCRDINCGLEIHYQDKIFDNCAPVFAGDKKGCPISFECSTLKTKLIRGLNIRTIGSQCVFGNMSLQVGDEVSVDEKCTRCSCDVPPFVSCSRKNVCDE